MFRPLVTGLPFNAVDLAMDLLLSRPPNQGRNKRGQGGHNSPGAESLPGSSNDCGGRRKVTTMSQVLSSIQYIYFLKTSNSNMEAPNMLLAPGAI